MTHEKTLRWKEACIFEELKFFFEILYAWSIKCENERGRSQGQKSETRSYKEVFIGLHKDFGLYPKSKGISLNVSQWGEM